MTSAAPGFLPRSRLGDLFAALAARGHRIVGPRERDGAIVYEDVVGPDDLPVGRRDRQAPGEYRLEDGGDTRCFAFATGPQALKPLLFRPRSLMWRVARDADGRLAFEDVEPEAEAIAVIGVRACDLAALALHDQHFMDGPFPDPDYAARRAKLLLIAVDCSHPADTCFCVSTGDGPTASTGYDLALAELDDGYLVRAGSDAGTDLAASLALAPATEAHLGMARAETEAAVARQVRTLPGRHLREPLFANLEHPRWDHVAARCLSCGNCTSVCPTCFCHAESEQPLLGLAGSEHYREWDSCFTQRHCEMHGYKVRPHIRQRYRQWLTHKLGSWHEQYGRSGCVGCGRCLTWCPAGIDMTEEAHAVCAGEPKP